jgi:hypothetical protein
MKTEKMFYDVWLESKKAVKDADAKFNSGEYENMYSVLQDVVLDSINVTPEILERWEFKDVKYIQSSKSSGKNSDESILLFDTPDGKFKVKVTAELMD